MPLYPFENKLPTLGERVFLAPSADLSGDIEVGDDSSFWFMTAARGDVHWIRIGKRTSIQDGSVLHVSYQTHPLTIGDDVVVGHSAMLHGCTIQNGALIGIGARVLDGAVVEEGAQVGAGAVVPPNFVVPKGHLALGLPSKVIRPLRSEESANIVAISERYVRLKNQYLEEVGPGTSVCRRH